MSKLNTFYRRFRFPLLMITMGIVLLIVVLCYSLIPIRNQISYIDMKDGGNYCNDIKAAYTSGVDLESFDNVTKVAEFVDNSNTQYDIHFDNEIGRYQDIKDYPPKIYGDAVDKKLVFDKNISFITGGNDNLKIEVYVMANIKQKDLIKKLFEFNSYYGLHHLPYVPKWEKEPYGYSGKNENLEKIMYTVYGNYKIKWALKDDVLLGRPIINNDNSTSNNDEIDPYLNAQFNYFVTITTKAGVTVKFVELPEDAPMPERQTDVN